LVENHTQDEMLRSVLHVLQPVAVSMTQEFNMFSTKYTLS